MYRLKSLAVDAYRQGQQAAADARVAQEEARQSRLRIGNLQGGGMWGLEASESLGGTDLGRGGAE